MAVKTSARHATSVITVCAAGALLLGCFLYLRPPRSGDDYNLHRYVSLPPGGADPADAIVKCLLSPPVDDGYYGVERCLSDVREKLMNEALDQIGNMPPEKLQRFQGVKAVSGWTPKWHGFDLFQPTYTCNPMHFIRTSQGDGGKWMCTDKLELGQSQECIIFSVGSDGNFDFEQAMKIRFPQCKIHTFDCTGAWSHNSTTFHPWCIAGEDKIDNGKRYMRMSSIVKELGIAGISVLKIDVENFEWPFFVDLESQDPRSRPIQVLVEFHAGCASAPQNEPFNLAPSIFADWGMNWARPALNMMRLLRRLGYRIAFQDRNPLAECASEFVLIHERGL